MFTKFLYNINEHLLLLGLLSFIVLPCINLLGYGFYPGTLISFFLGFVCVFKCHKDKDKIKINKLFFLLLTLIYVIFLCNYYGYLKFDYGISLGDFTETIKYIQYLPYLLFANLCNNNKLFKLSKKYINIASFLLIIIGFIQIFKIPILFDLIMMLYLNPNSSQIINMTSKEKGYSRILLTGSDPNIGAIISLFCFVYFVNVIKQNKSPINYINLALFFIFIILTQSRTIILALIFSISLYILLFANINWKRKTILLFSFIFLLITFVIILDSQYLIGGFNSLGDGNNTSFNLRLENIYNAYQNFLMSPFFGLGVCKNHLPTIMDCEYASILQRYGFIGMFVFLAINILLFFTSLKNKNSYYSFPLTILTMANIIIMCTNNVFSGYQVFSIYVLLYILNVKTNC